MTGFALGLTLKQRWKATRKSPIEDSAAFIFKGLHIQVYNVVIIYSPTGLLPKCGPPASVEEQNKWLKLGASCK